MKRTRKSDPVIYVLVVFLAVLILISAVLGAAYLKLTESDQNKSIDISEKNQVIEENRQLIEEQQALIADYEAMMAENQTSIAVLTEQTDTLRTEVKSLTGTIEKLLDEKTAESEILAGYMSQLEKVKQQLAEKETELTENLNLLENYQKLVVNNHRYQSEKITALFEMLEKDVPLKPVEIPEDTDSEEPAGTSEESSETEATESGETDIPEKIIQEMEKAALAYYYCDLSTGYTIAYNETEVMYSASLIKAPYICCILEEIAEFEENKRQYSADGEKLYDEDGNPLFEGEHPNLNEDGSIKYLPGEEKYDLSREWTYDSASMFKEGSGEIQSMEDGTVMSYRELVEYTLLYSDNVAFAELRKVFGMDSFNQKVSELGIEGTAYGFMQLTAEDCGKFLTEIYHFFETGSEYALLMKDCMTRSKHTVMIVSALYGKTVAHKYGWDIGAYHDMAVVLEEHPYVLVIMTDLENGGGEANAFIQKLTKLTDEIHNSHYS